MLHASLHPVALKHRYTNLKGIDGSHNTSEKQTTGPEGNETTKLFLLKVKLLLMLEVRTKSKFDDLINCFAPMS